MMLFWLYRVAFGIAALAACIFAVRSVLRHHRTLSFYLTLSGIITLILFLVVPDTPSELIMISLLAVATGALLMPSENQRSTHELLDEDIEVGDSTATRRLKK
jgi:hypothetical protein